MFGGGASVAGSVLGIFVNSTFVFKRRQQTFLRIKLEGGFLAKFNVVLHSIFTANSALHGRGALYIGREQILLSCSGGAMDPRELLVCFSFKDFRCVRSVWHVDISLPASGA